MSFQFPEGLAPEVYPLAWLVGSWRGPGYVDYPNIPERPIVVETTFSHDGGPYLIYSSTTWLLDGELQGLEAQVDQADLVAGDVWSSESGYWRVPPGGQGEPGNSNSPPTSELEVLLADPAGHISVLLGVVKGPQIQLASDVIARTETGADIASAQRKYGLVEGELFWATDLAAFGHEMASYAAGRLQRMS